MMCRICQQKLAKTRGCCVYHYQIFQLAVKRGETTWAELEAAGKVLPAKISPWKYVPYKNLPAKEDI